MNNVVAVLTDLETLAERYAYTPYGGPAFLAGDWSLRNLSNEDMAYLFQGGRYDPNTKYYLFGSRDLTPALGRWMENDPIGFGGGDVNLYRFAANNPTNLADPSGNLVPLVVGIGVLAVEMWGLYAANRAVANYGEMDAMLARPGAFDPQDSARFQDLNSSARWNGAVANVAMVTAMAYSIGFGAGAGLAALGSVAAPLATTLSLGLGGWGVYQLGQGIHDTVANWDRMDGPDRFQAVASFAGGLIGGAGGFMSGRGFAGWIGKQFSSRSISELLQEIARRAESRIGGTGSTPGIYKHSYAQRLLDRYQSMYGDRGLITEARYLNGNVWRPGMGLRDTVRLDVIQGPRSGPTAVWDYKFGAQGLTLDRIAEIRAGANLGPNVPIYEIRP